MSDTNHRITELESRIVFLEDTVDQLNDQLATLSNDFLMARQAMQLINKRLEQLQNNTNAGEPGKEAPPPHY